MDIKDFIFGKYYEWWKNLDKFIFSVIILLFLTGLFFSLVSTSLIASDKLDTNDYSFFFKHLVFIILGLIIIFLFSSLDQEQLYKFSVMIFLISIVLLVLVPIIGVEVKGSKRWIDFYLLPRFQPIELVKPFLIIFVSLTLTYKRYNNIYLKYLFSFLITLLIALLLAMQPDIGQTILIFFSWLILIFTSGINILLLVILFLTLVSVFLYLIFFVNKFEYIKDRLFSFFDSDIGTHNFQSDKAIESIISGGFFGKGIGEGTLNTRVPEAHTDYVISVISEEFGILFILFILALFLFLVFRVFKKIPSEQNNCNKLILIGSILLIIFQVLIHIGVNIRFLPTTGMTLPFLSYGGSSILSSSILAGLILNFTKRKI